MSSADAFGWLLALVSPDSKGTKAKPTAKLVRLHIVDLELLRDVKAEPFSV